MHRLLILLTIVLLLTFKAFSQVQALEDGLWLAEITDDAGIQTGTLSVRNEGGDTIALTSIRTNCGCVQAALDKELLAPMDSATVTISFNPLGFMGVVQKKVTLAFEPNHQKLDLSVGANVKMSETTLKSKYPIAINLSKGSRTSAKLNSKEESTTVGQFLFNRLDVTLKAAPKQSLPVLTYNHSDVPISIVITKQPKHVKAQPLLATIAPECACTLLIETTEDFPNKSSKGKIKGKIVDADKSKVLGTFVIDLNIIND